VTTASPSTASLVARYADRFDAAMGATGHTVASPLGAWLLVALAAPLTTGAERVAVEEVLGTDADDAHSRVTELVAHAHPAVGHAVAVWHRAERVRPVFSEWSASLIDVETGTVPTPQAADHWVAEHTNDLVEHFPVPIDDLTAIVLASALATKVNWTVPFETVSSRMLMTDHEWPPPPDSWAAQVQTALQTPDDGHEVHVFDTERAGPVGVHAAAAREGLLVVSVIADPSVARPDVRAAAHDVAATLCGIASPSARRIALADLPLGRGHSWIVIDVEVDADRDPRAEASTAVLPAWACRADHDLLAVGAPGVPETLAAIADLIDDSAGPPDVKAGQGVAARITAEGFEAAAVTALEGLELGGSIPARTLRRRSLAMSFGRAYAAVAVARDDAAPTPQGWHGVPVFSAWIEEPAEAASPDD
jgi:hypothetical protein